MDTPQHQFEKLLCSLQFLEYKNVPYHFRNLRQCALCHKYEILKNWEQNWEKRGVPKYSFHPVLCRLLFIIWKNTPTLIFGSIFCSVMPWQSAIKTTAKSNRKLCKEDTSKKLQLHQWFLLLRKITIFLIFSIKYTDVRQEVLTSLITEWWVICSLLSASLSL